MRTLEIPDNVYRELEKAANDQDTSVEKLIQRGFQWSLIENSVKKQGGQILIKRNPQADLVEIE